MALLQNGYRDFSSGVRIFGATASNNAYPYALIGNSALSGTKRNIIAGEAWTDEKLGLPYGYRNEYAWLQPQKNGGLKSVNEVEGVASASFAIAGGKNGEATISGSGALTATGGLVVSGTASIAGSVSISASVLAALNGTASISCSGSVTATLVAKGWGIAALTGSATITATRYATGTLEADITPFTELSPTSLANAVWAQALEAGYTAEEMMRVMAAALAGEVSGAGTSTVTIRDIADTTDRIVASVDGSGNRTAVTLDVD